MKKTILVLIFCSLAVVSCDLLDIDPALSLSEETAIKTKKDVMNAVNGCYDAMQQTGYYSRDFIVIGDLPADNLDATGTIADFRSIDLFTHRADNTIVLNMWVSMYDAINRINNVLFRIDGVADMTDDEKTAVKAELLFLRGLHYFNLVRVFGAVPYRDTPTLNAGEALNVARMPVVSVYQKILEDLLFAEPLLPNGTNIRANKWAAKAVLAKVYLTLGQYSNALTKADDVIANGGFVIAPNFETLFVGTNNEVIFSIDFNAQDKTLIAQYFAPTNLGGRKEFWPTASIVSAYTATDSRKASTIGPAGQGYKYRDIATGIDRVFVIRLADMFLTRAEAGANEPTPTYTLTNVRDDINTIRNRAGLLNYGGADNTLLDEILLQRRLEFAFEGHRWFDLVRTGKASTVLGSGVKLLFPIPEAEITSNNLIGPGDQNPGY
jgi:hypothetical protein